MPVHLKTTRTTAPSRTIIYVLYCAREPLALAFFSGYGKHLILLGSLRQTYKICSYGISMYIPINRTESHPGIDRTSTSFADQIAIFRRSIRYHWSMRSFRNSFLLMTCSHVALGTFSKNSSTFFSLISARGRSLEVNEHDLELLSRRTNERNEGAKRPNRAKREGVHKSHVRRMTE